MSVASGPRAVLVAVIGLLLVTELALSPFYPQLLRQLYGVEDPGAVGLLLWACRAAGLLALPLLGLVARRVPLVRLVTAGLAACVVLDAALVVAPSAGAFIALSAAGAAAGSALLLAYPALVALDEDHGPGVLAFVALLHGATVVATALGAAILALPDPRTGLAVFAVVDLVLLVLVARTLGRAAPTRIGPPLASRLPLRRSGTVVAVVAVALVFELAVNVARPFFTSYAEQAGLSLATAAVLFLLPSVAALATLPLARRARALLGPALLPLALAASALGLGVQAVWADPTVLVAGRLVLGSGIALAHVELDVAMYAAVGTDGPGYAAVETVRGLALTLAPVLAAASVVAGLAGPLAVGGVLFALGSALAPALHTVPALEDAHAHAR